MIKCCDPRQGGCNLFEGHAGGHLSDDALLRKLTALTEQAEAQCTGYGAAGDPEGQRWAWVDAGIKMRDLLLPRRGEKA